MNPETIKIVLGVLQEEKGNLDTLGVKYEDERYMPLEEAINAMYKLAKASHKKEKEIK